MTLLNPPAYNKGVVNDWNNIEIGIKYEPSEPPANSTGAVNDWSNIESGNKHEPPETPCL
jgi:hypothetical protein